MPPETVPTIDDLRRLREAVIAENPGAVSSQLQWRSLAELAYCEATARYVDAMLDTPKPTVGVKCVKCKACDGVGLETRGILCKPCKGWGWIDVVP